MFRPNTTAVAAPVAQTFTDRGQIIAVKSDNYPLAALRSNYTRPNVDALKSDQEVLHAIRQANPHQHERADEDFNALVELTSNGVQTMLNRARLAIIPAVNNAFEAYQTMATGAAKPQVEVKPVVFHSIHHNPTLVGHVDSKYNYKTAHAEYRSFLMECPSASTLIEWVSTTPHVDKEEVAKWALTLDAEELRFTYQSLFGEKRVLEPYSLLAEFRSALVHGGLDRALFAYLLTGYLCHNPQNVKGESVTLEEWERGLSGLHVMMGGVLRELYLLRASNRKKGKLILKTSFHHSTNEITEVFVNGDIYEEYLEDGGDVRAILGAAALDPNVNTVPDLKARKENLVKGWDRKYYIMRQTAVDKFMRDRREMIRIAITHIPCSEVENTLPKQTEEIRGRIEAELGALRASDLDDVRRAIVKVICHAFYPGTSYYDFLQAMDRQSSIYPDCTPREAALGAVIEMVGLYLAKQLTLVETDVIPYSSNTVVEEGAVDEEVPAEA